MTPTQREAVRQLAESLRYFELDEHELIEAVALLQELAADQCGYDETTGNCTQNPCCRAKPHYTITWDAQGRRLVNGELAPEHQTAEPVQEPATVKESLQVGPAQAFYKDADAEPAYAQYARGVKDGFELGQREARIAIEDGAANEPVQEPYCTVYEYDSALGLHQELYPRPWNGMKPTRAIPLYAAPQQRKPLTDEQIYAAISDQVFWATSKKFIVRVVRDVERAHGIKETP